MPSTSNNAQHTVGSRCLLVDLNWASVADSSHNMLWQCVPKQLKQLVSYQGAGSLTFYMCCLAALLTRLQHSLEAPPLLTQL